MRVCSGALCPFVRALRVRSYTYSAVGKIVPSDMTCVRYWYYDLPCVRWGISPVENAQNAVCFHGRGLVIIVISGVVIYTLSSWSTCKCCANVIASFKALIGPNAQ